MDLKYHFLGDFDQAMLQVISSVKNFQDTPIQKVWDNDGDQILAYMRKDLVFVFNFSPNKSFSDYGFLVPKGEYEVVLNTDATQFGGYGLSDDSVRHFTQFDELYKKEKKEWLLLYVPARSAVVLRKVKPAPKSKSEAEEAPKAKSTRCCKKTKEEAPKAKKTTAKKASAKKTK